MAAPGHIKRSITIAGHRTSISLEQDFWESLKEISRSRKMSVSQLVQQIDAKRLGVDEPASSLRTTSGLSSAIRVYVLGHYKHQARDINHD